MRRHVLAAAVLVLALGSGNLATATPDTSPRPGAGSIGDPYFKHDGNGGYDVQHYQVRNRYEFGSGRLAGRTRITARSTHRLSRFQLDFLLPVKTVRVNGRKARFNRPNKHELRIRPRTPIADGSTFTVVVTYAGKPGNVGWRGEKNWLANRHEVVTMGQPHMAPWWFPANNHPRDKARMDIRISVPRGNQVIANGELVKRKRQGKRVLWHWRAKEPMAPYLAFFAAGKFKIARGTTQGLPWVAAVSKRLKKPARRRMMKAMKRSPGMVRWLETQVGAYPFRSTGGLVTSLNVGFALENQTRPTYPNVPGDITWLLIHELAHQWFGNHVAVESWSDIWLNEGFATFFEARWFETHGGASAQDWLLDAYQQGSSSFWSVRIGAPGPKRMFHGAIYQRGGMTLQALRNRIGEADFWTLVRTWVQRYGGGNASTADFRALAEEISGQDLDGFFTAWLLTSGKPAPTAANGLG